MKGDFDIGVGVVYYIVLGLFIALCIFMIFNFMRGGGMPKIASLLSDSVKRKVVGP